MVFLSETCDGYNSRTRARDALGPIFPDALRQGLSNEPKTTPIDSAVVEIRSLRGLRMQRSAMVIESLTGTSIAGGPNRKKNRTAANPPTVESGRSRQESFFKPSRAANAFSWEVYSNLLPWTLDQRIFVQFVVQFVVLISPRGGVWRVWKT